MELRQIGTSELEVAPIAFGGNVFGWTADQKTSFSLLDQFTEAGFNMVDTADVYSRWAEGNSGGESESIIGKWVSSKKNRKQLVIATKVGMDMGNGQKGLRKNYILKAAEDSLKRLKTDYIDLYQAHTDDESTPLDETLEAFQILIQQGKVRYIGASNYTAQRLKESLAVSAEKSLPGYCCLQPHYNLYAREGFEDGLEPVCLGNKLGVITYYSLESGFLTGKYRNSEDKSKSIRGGKMDSYFNERGNRILAALDKAAKELNSSPASVALAWLINRPSVTAPIVSATNSTQLKEILSAADIALNADVVRFLNSESTW